MKTVLKILILFFPTLIVSGQDSIQQRLENSPRHQEWVVVKNGERPVHCFVVYPQMKEKATAVLVIHENKGLTDWVRSLADQLAEAGATTIAPDLLSGLGPNQGKTSDFPSIDAATEALYKLQPDQVISDLNAVSDYVTKLPASNGKLAVAGFCWGGGQSLRFATRRRELNAAFIFYGTTIHTKEEIALINCPVYGFYGSNDARINATLPGTAETMKEAGKTFDPVTYDGADHGFMRKGEEPDASSANKEARTKAWERWKAILNKLSTP